MQQAISTDLHAMDDGIMKKVLIVDDEEDMIWSLQKNLSNSKLQVETITASSGEEALEVLNQTAVDLIVTDIKMPGMSGLDLLSKVNSRYPDLGVIVMTAYSSQECQTEAIIRGGLSYIEKPFDINEMRRVINQALQSKEDTMYGEPSGDDIKDISTLAMKIPAVGENEFPDYIVKNPKNVQEILSEEGDIEDSIVNSLLNFSVEDLLSEDELCGGETVLADGRSIEDNILASLIGVSEESEPATPSRETRTLENDEPAVTNQETFAPEDDVPAQTNQEASAPENNEPVATNHESCAPEDEVPAPADQKISTSENDGPPQTRSGPSALENNEPAETNWVISTRDDSEPAETNWVINTRDNYEPEDTVQEIQEPENDEEEETNWVIRTRDNYEPPQSKWVINTRDNCEPAETVQETQEPENDKAEKNKWVVKTRDNYKPVDIYKN